MKEIVEFRVRETYVREFLSDDVENCVDDSSSIIRIYRTPVGSDLYKKIEKLTEYVKHRDQEPFFLGWKIQRIYTKEELISAELLLLKINKTFEPAGLECGTLYENKNNCAYCGYGSDQKTDLILDFKTIPKKIDIARTISNEIIISQTFVKKLEDNRINGYELRAVHNNKLHQQNLIWSQLFVTSWVDIASNSITGIKPFDLDDTNAYRCRNGHTIGLDILSELSIIKTSWDGSDFIATKQLLGVNRGLLHTYSLIAVSQRLYQILINGKIRGFTTEVVHVL